MKLTSAILIFAALACAQDKSPAAKPVDQLAVLKARLAEKDKQIEWLTKKLALTVAQESGLNMMCSATQQMTELEAQKPVTK